MDDHDIAAAMEARTVRAGQRWGSTGALAVVDAAEQFAVEEYELGRQPLLLTKTQAAAQLAVSVRQLSRWIAAGEIIPTRIGTVVRFAPDELRAFVQRNTVREAPVTWPEKQRTRRSRR